MTRKFNHIHLYTIHKADQIPLLVAYFIAEWNRPFSCLVARASTSLLHSSTNIGGATAYEVPRMDNNLVHHYTVGGA